MLIKGLVLFIGLATFDLEAKWQVSPALDLGTRLYDSIEGKKDITADPQLWIEFDYENSENGLESRFKPIVNLGATNDSIPNFDIQELYIRKAIDNWQITAGMNTLFWGVAESRHLVDIVNQRIPIRSLEGEEKLGEFVGQLDYFTENGQWSLLSLPLFRERDFALPEQRFSMQKEINTSQFVGLSKQNRSSFLIRYASVLDDWDLGTYFFQGLDRLPAFDKAYQSTVIYSELKQWAIDAQYTSDTWLGKLEAVHRHHSYGGKSWAYTLGAEYYFYGIHESNKDLSMLFELHRDTDAKMRENQVYRNASFAGTRLAWNDTSATTLLIGALIDNSGDSIAIKSEFETRIYNQLSLDVEVRLFLKQRPYQPLYQYKNDDFVEVRLTYYL